MPGPSSAITLDNITRPTRRETGTSTFAIQVSLSACVEAHKKENNHGT